MHNENPTSLLAASVLAADWLNFGVAVEISENAGADLIQIDVADGHFAPTITFGEELVKRIREKTKLPIEVHLMVSRPQDWISMMADIGVDFILFHAEAAQRLHAVIEMCKNADVGAGVVLNSETDPTVLKYVLPYVDIVTLMAIVPGFAGQPFIPETMGKISKLRQLVDDLPADRPLIEVDGGIKTHNAREVVRAGADILIASSGIFHAPDPVAAGEEFKREMAWPDEQPRHRIENIAAFFRKVKRPSG